MFEEKLRAFHAARNHANSSRQLIRGAVRHYQRLGFTSFDDKSLEAYRDARQREGVAAATIRGEMNKLLAFARFLGHNPVVKLPRKTMRAPVAWTKKELRTLFAEARRTTRTIYGLPASVYFTALVSLCIDSGERVGAIFRVEWNAVNWGERTIRYPAEIRKGGYRDMVAPLSRESLAALKALRAITPRPLEGDPIFGLGSRTNLWRSYAALLADCQLPHDRRRLFHCLRRTAASSVHASGGDATAFLGHSSDAITRESYLAPWSLRARMPWRPGRWLRWLGL